MAQHRRIYLDTAAATPVSEVALAAMKPFWRGAFGNPSSISKEGVAARRAVELARASVARVFGVQPREIIFTSGGTEGNNLAIFGVLGMYPGSGALCVTEHPSVLAPFRALEKKGRAVSWIPVDEFGRVDLAVVKKVLAGGADLVSIMYANNEIGTVQPIREIVKLVRAERMRRNPKDPLGLHAPFFHLDACQAPGALPLDFGRMGVDVATISAQKFYGPKGVGALYLRSGVKLAPRMQGGGHEYGLRAGTENVPLIVGMAAALEDAEKKRERESARLLKLRTYFIQKVCDEISGATLSGHPNERLPNNAHVSFPGIESELLVLDLDARGIAVSSGSACGTHADEPSYVVRALGKSAAYARTGVRFTLGSDTTKAALDATIRAIKDSLSLQKRFPVQEG